MRLRSSLGRAFVASCLLTTLAACSTLYLFGLLGTLTAAQFWQTVGFFYLFGLPGTALGLFIVGIPLTKFGEKFGSNNRISVAKINLTVAAVGFVAAAISGWPMAEVKQMVWLHLGFAALIFTLVYIPGRHAASDGNETRDA